MVVAASSMFTPVPLSLSVVLAGLNPTYEPLFCCEGGDVKENVTLTYSCSNSSGPSPDSCAGASPGPGAGASPGPATPACCHKLVGTWETQLIVTIHQRGGVYICKAATRRYILERQPGGIFTS